MSEGGRTDSDRADSDRADDDFSDDELERAVDALIDSATAPGAVFQPIAHLPVVRVVGYEMLSRFTDQPSVGPDRWFAAAARIGREADLSALVVEKALSSRAVLPRHCFLSVNVSPDALLSDRVRSLLECGSLTRMVFELTEHAVVADYDRVAATVAHVRELGGFVAVDDAGAGYASLHHILTLHPDFVKLDGSLVTDLHRDAAKAALVEMFGEFCSRIDAWLIAEGIESPRDLHRLQQLGVPLGQGYLLGRPTESMGGIDPEVSCRTAEVPTSADTVERFVEAGRTAPVGASDSALSVEFGSDPELAAIVLLDARANPTHLAIRHGDHGVARHPAMRVHRSADRREVLRRAMTRPPSTRFDPLVCWDETGRYTGLIPIDRLVSSLATAD